MAGSSLLSSLLVRCVAGAFVAVVVLFVLGPTEVAYWHPALRSRRHLPAGSPVQSSAAVRGPCAPPEPEWMGTVSGASWGLNRWIRSVLCSRTALLCSSLFSLGLDMDCLVTPLGFCRAAPRLIS